MGNRNRRDTRVCSRYDSVGCLDGGSSDDDFSQAVVVSQLQGGLQRDQDALTKPRSRRQDSLDDLLLGGDEGVHDRRFSNLRGSHVDDGTSKNVMPVGCGGWNRNWNSGSF